MAGSQPWCYKKTKRYLNPLERAAALCLILLGINHGSSYRPSRATQCWQVNAI